MLGDHVTLSIASFDCLYLNGYLQTLHSSGQLVAFCREQPGGADRLAGAVRTAA